MAIESIISLLVAERDRLNVAIGLLSDGAGAKRRGRPPKNPLADAPSWVTGKPEPVKKRIVSGAQSKKRLCARIRLID